MFIPSSIIKQSKEIRLVSGEGKKKVEPGHTGRIGNLQFRSSRKPGRETFVIGNVLKRKVSSVSQVLEKRVKLQKEQWKERSPPRCNKSDTNSDVN